MYKASRISDAHVKERHSSYKTEVVTFVMSVITIDGMSPIRRYYVSLPDGSRTQGCNDLSKSREFIGFQDTDIDINYCKRETSTMGICSVTEYRIITIVYRVQ